MKLEQRIHALLDSDAAATLAGIRRGIEKESLRITTDGTLAQTPHPAALGSALTHPYITTDYSEALLEFITPPSTELHKPLEFLEQLHRYVYSHIGDEVLWVNSMPCMISNDADVPVAQYGSSNVGRMKSVYREGLGHRYGRKMQTIAGIHYNFSYPEEFWKLNQVLEGERGPLQDYISKRYFDLTRNFQRYSWLLVYLFGASPALCKSFLAGREHQLDTFDHTLFKPNATSLRMSDLGYQSNAQAGLTPCYDEKKPGLPCNFDANGYRLPTEAEWEFAALAGSDRDYDFGTARKLKHYAFYGENGQKRTHPVGTKKPNAFGFHGLYGNVSEWCQDAYDADYYQKGAMDNPSGPKVGAADVKRAVRGGSWKASARMCRAHFRQGKQTGDTDACFTADFLGFRCVRRITEAELAKLRSP